MIALDESVLRLVDLVPARAVDSGLRALVDGLGPAHRAELAELRRLAERARLPATNEHEGHDMPGMVTADELTRIGGLAGADFDEAVRVELREHLEQCSRLAVSEQRSGTDVATKELAARVQRSRDAVLASLR